MLAGYEAAGYADLLALLFEHQVAYPRAVELAAEATGNSAMIAGARQLAAAVQHGEAPDQAVRDLPASTVRPLLRWTLAATKDQGSLVESLRNLAPMYRRAWGLPGERSSSSSCRPS